MIPVTGISAELIDKRVQKILLRNGYVVAEEDIYYSPIKSWLVYFTMVLGMIFPFLIGLFLFNWFYTVGAFCLYLLLAYIFLGAFNYSIVVYNDELLFVNPNFSFFKIKKYAINEIKKIEIGTSLKWLPISWIFFVFTRINYLDVTIKGKKKRFYCMFLKEDYFDENLTEKILDDLYYRLKEKEIKVFLKKNVLDR
jgi:hypothetical protein